MKKTFEKHSAELRGVLGNLGDFHDQVHMVVKHVQEAFLKGKKVLVAGNGGSATLAQHLSDEMVGKYSKDRMPYPVIALTADSAVITCIANDYGYEQVFSRQIEALGKEGDIFIGFSTSGNSKNILMAAEQAKDQGMTVIAFTGQAGKLRDLADHAVVSPGKTTNRIQELDLHAIHLICEAFEPEASQGNS